jgi:type IV secretory pathway TrbF-like protein
MSSLFVAMTDSFFSGWGASEGKVNRFVVECDTYSQAQKVARAAHRKGEMSRIKIVTTEPKSSDQTLVSLTHFNHLSQEWLEKR